VQNSKSYAVCCGKLLRGNGMTTLDHWKTALNSVGWFIPPYMQMGVIGALAGEIVSKGSGFNQADLERHLLISP
jgi:hypothetical protein